MTLECERLRFRPHGDFGFAARTRSCDGFRRSGANLLAARMHKPRCRSSCVRKLLLGKGRWQHGSNAPSYRPSGLKMALLKAVIKKATHRHAGDEGFRSCLWRVTPVKPIETLQRIGRMPDDQGRLGAGRGVGNDHLHCREPNRQGSIRSLVSGGRYAPVEDRRAWDRTTAASDRTCGYPGKPLWRRLNPDSGGW